MALLDPGSLFPSNVTTSPVESGDMNIGAYMDQDGQGSGSMGIGSYNELLSPMKTSAFPSSPATGEGDCILYIAVIRS